MNAAVPILSINQMLLAPNVHLAHGGGAPNWRLATRTVSTGPCSPCPHGHERSHWLGDHNVLKEKGFGEEEGNRMRKIMEFTFAHYDRKLSVSRVAEIASMTPNAFCRYFEQRTNKTYINFVLEIRIGQACRLLKQRKDLQISEIAFQCGFNNLTNFNRKFKQLKKLTPSEFRQGDKKKPVRKDSLNST